MLNWQTTNPQIRRPIADAIQLWALPKPLGSHTFLLARDCFASLPLCAAAEYLSM
ncbi:MAG: hypothetical protein LBK25_03655 [Treponema sp.]|nr:hypothetical protein [Treponema sp.]